MRRGVAMIVAVAGACGLVACGSSGPSSSQFVGQIDTVCRTLGSDLGALDAPSSLADEGAFASKASKTYEDALLALKKLPVPGSGSLVADAKNLLSNYDDQITLLDAISTAAGKGDQATVDAKITKFKSLESSDADLADSLGAKRCSLDPLFSATVTTPPVTTPPVTDAPVTVPPITAPVVTVPPVTLPPETLPPVTEPPNSNSNKTVIALAPQLLPVAGYTFGDADSSLVETFASLLDSSPQTQAQPGQVAAVEVTDSSGVKFSRVFVYLPTSPLPSSALVELIPALTGTAATQAGKFGGLDGVVYQSSNGLYWFIASDSITASHVIVWATAKSTQGLDLAITAFIKSLPK